jgi:hypothetical protein
LGTRAELEASEAYIYLSKLGVDLQISELDWLASVLVWAEEELQNIGGGIVGYFMSGSSTEFDLALSL